MFKIIFNQVAKRLFPGKAAEVLTRGELQRVMREATQIMNRTKGKTGDVVQFPSGGIHNIPVDRQFTRSGSREIFEVLDDDAYQALKGDYFRRLIANTDDDAKAFAKRVIENKQDVKLERLTKDQRKDMLTMITDRIQMGNRKFMKEYDPKFPVDEGFASGGRIGMMYGGDPGFAFEYGGSWADWHDQHRDQMPVEQYIKTKLPKHRLPFREMQSGGLAYMLGEPTYMKYGAGGSVGHAPWLKPSGQPQLQGQEETPPPQVVGTPDPLKAPRGIPSVAPKNMDPAYMQQQMMQKAMMGQGPRPMANEGGRIGFDKGGYWSKLKKKYKGSTLQAMLDNPQLMAAELGHEGVFSLLQMLGMKEGGRARFDKGKKVDLSKRRFLKGTGAAVGLLSMLPFVGKFFKAAKLAKPAAAVTETIIKSNAPGMPAWFPSLVKRVLKEGTDDTAKLGTIERQTVHTAKTPEGTPIQITRDLTTDDIIVDIGEQTKHGWASGRHGQPTRLVLKKGEWIEPTKGKKGIKTKDEFMVEEAEFTGGHPENVKFEETVDFKYGDHGSDFSEVERYAIGKNKDKKIIGRQADKDAWAEGRAESQADEYDKMRDEGYFDEAEKDFYEGKASGGLAGLLGE